MKKNRTIEVNVKELGGLGGVLQDLLNDIMGEEKEEKKIPIGIISDDLRKKYLAWKDSKDDFDHELKLEKERIERKVLRELNNLFEERFHENQRAKAKIWKEIRAELNIQNDDLSLNIDTKTGVISQWVETHEHKH